MKNLDKTAWLGIVLCIGILGFSLQQNARQAAERDKVRAARQLEQDKQEKIAEIEKGINEVGEMVRSNGENTDAVESDRADSSSAALETAELTTDKFKLTFTNKGAGVQTAQLLNHKRQLDSQDEYVTINEDRPSPIGALSSGPERVDNSIWTLEDQTSNSVTFAKTTKENLRVTKTYRIPDDGRPYEIEMDLGISNESGASIDLADTDLRYIYAGGAQPLHANEWSMQIGMFYRDNHYHAKTVDYFGGKGKVLGIFGRSEKPYAVFPGEEKISENLSYAGVNNQFYATLIQAVDPIDGKIWADKYKVQHDGVDDTNKRGKVYGTELAIGIADLEIAPGQQKDLIYQIFMGPKREDIFDSAHSERHLVMNYDQIPIFGDLFGWAISPLAKYLLKGLNWIYSWCGNYGVAIILLTIIVRLLMWPVYAKSSRSMKRMSKLAPLQKELKAKYEDDPQKLNQETMKLYREYNINPLGGCLPMFLQLPIFLGFYRMLWGAVELRHESFWFVQDLTMPDQLTTIAGFTVNLLPILMAAASFGQMAMMPKTGDSTQRMIFMLMPWMFLIFCYNFASGLALYWTVSNVFTIFQTWLMNKLPEPELTKPDPKKKKPSGKKGFMEKIQDRLEEAQRLADEQKKNGGEGGIKNLAANVSAAKKAKAKEAKSAPQPGQSRTKVSSERGQRHTKSKKRKKKR